jgi:hypothetical protein
MSQPARAALAFAAALLCAASCRRFPTGTIEGTVRDRSGTPIANVGVGVVGLAPYWRSDASGRYRLHPSVPVGTHRVRAGLSGYALQVRDSIVVRKGLTTRVDFILDRKWTNFREPTAASQDRAQAAPTRKEIEARRRCGWARTPSLGRSAQARLCPGQLTAGVGVAFLPPLRRGDPASPPRSRGHRCRLDSEPSSLRATRSLGAASGPCLSDTTSARKPQPWVSGFPNEQASRARDEGERQPVRRDRTTALCTGYTDRRARRPSAPQ